MEVRDRWAAQFGETRNDPFTLLRHMGHDAPGSAQIVPHGAEPSQLGGLSEITDVRIAEREAEFGGEIVSRMTSAEIADTTVFDPPANRDSVRRGRVWVPGELKNGRRETGSYRKRGQSR